MAQNKSNKEQVWLIKKCKEDIFAKFIGNSPLKFTHADFEKLSDEIFECTRTSISISTLKRIWKEDYQGLPNISTLDAFAKYLGYSNWRSYCNKYHVNDKLRTSHFLKFNKKYLRNLLIALLVLILVAVIAYYIKPNKIVNPDYSMVEFTFIEFDSTQIPVNAVFKYNLKGVKCDSATIRPLGNHEDEFAISTDDSIATYTYIRPWNYYPTLVIDGKSVKTLKTSFTSGVWKAGLSNLKKEFYIQYYDNPEIYSGGRLHFTNKILDEINFPRDDIDYITYDLFKRFNMIYGDSLCFETRIRNKVLTRERNAGAVNVALCFNEGYILIPLSMDKSPYTSLTMGFFERFISGKNHDLSFLYNDLEVWNTIKFRTADKQFTLYINDSLVYSDTYKMEPGKLVGIMFDFKGLGEVDYVKFYNAKDLIYQDEFD
ncbi:MAG: hypothetical protein PVF73_12155 [Bacteroidales bacterium]|jgi:hypothetical protein